jgi:hypothetical protein
MRSTLRQDAAASLILLGIVAVFSVTGTSAFVPAKSVLAQGRPAPAQGESAPVSSQRTINLTEENRHAIREIVLKDMAVRKTPANVKAEIGDPAPVDVVSFEFPPQLTERIPALQSHRYFVMSDDEIVVVDSKAGKVADIVKAEMAK